MQSVLLNIDVGELELEPPELYRMAHVVNIACGGHAGDVHSMTKALNEAVAAGTLVGAHPSYPDREGFGRRAPVGLSREALGSSLEAQLRALSDVARHAHARIAFLKPHGALYHDAHLDDDLARLVMTIACDILGNGIAVLGPAGGRLESAAVREGMGFLREGFADRAVRADGTLVPRTEPNALIVDPRIAAARGTTLARSGSVDTVCVHGDTPGAVAIAEAVRRSLDDLAASPLVS